MTRLKLYIPNIVFLVDFMTQLRRRPNRQNLNALILPFTKKEARMVACRTVVERIQPWLKALNLYYYEYMGKLEDRDIFWVDSPHVDICISQ